MQPPMPAKIDAAATANGRTLRIRVSPFPSARARRRPLPRSSKPLHAAFDFNYLLRMTGIARMSRRRAKCIVSIAGAGRGFRFLSWLEATAIQTIQTPHLRDTSPIQAPGSIALGVTHAESDVPGYRYIQAVSLQVFTSEGLRTEIVAEGGDAQNRAQAHRDGGPSCGSRTRALSARARVHESEHVRLGHRKQCRLYLSRDARDHGLRPGSAVLAGKLAPVRPSR